MVYRYRLSTFIALGVLITAALSSLLLPNATNAAQTQAPILAATATAVASADGGDPALPQPVDGCPYLTATDAAALLQEEVQAQAFGNLLLAPAEGGEYPFASALCGYVSQADQPASPYLATQVAAARAVVAVDLLGGDAIKLMPLLDIVRSSRPNTNPASQRFNDERVVFEALLWGENRLGVIEYLHALTHDQPTMHVRYVGDLGGDNVWVWAELEEGRFALLITDSGNVIAALLSQAANEQAALDVASDLALQMQGSLPPNSQTPRTGECEFLNHTDAMRTLNHPLPLAADQGAGLCGYGGMAQRLVEADLIPLEELPDGIASGVLAGEAAKAFLLRFGATLYEENPAKDAVIYANLKEQVASGDFEKAIDSLKYLAEEKRWSWTTGTGEGTHLFYRLTNEADRLAIEILLRPDGLLGVIVAKLPRHRSIYGAFEWLVNDNSDLINKAPRDLQPTPTVTPSPTPTAGKLPFWLEGLGGDKPKTCSLITVEEAESILGHPVIVIDSLSAIYFYCVYGAATPLASSPTAELTTFLGPYVDNPLFAELQQAAPEREESYQQLQQAIDSLDWETVFQMLLVLSDDLPGWHGERVNSEVADNFFLRHANAQSQGIFWQSIDKATGLSLLIAGTVPLERDDATVIAALQKVTDNFWQKMPDSAEGEAVATLTPTPVGK